MATVKEKVLAKHPNARAKRFKDNGGIAYYLLWSEGVEQGVRLGQGKTESAAFVDAAIRMDI